MVKCRCKGRAEANEANQKQYIMSSDLAMFGILGTLSCKQFCLDPRHVFTFPEPDHGTPVIHLDKIPKRSKNHRKPNQPAPAGSRHAGKHQETEEDTNDIKRYEMIDTNTTNSGQFAPPPPTEGMCKTNSQQTPAGVPSIMPLQLAWGRMLSNFCDCGT